LANSFSGQPRYVFLGRNLALVTASVVRRSSLALSLALSLSCSPSWADEAIGTITFTADNAASVYLNGEFLGHTDDWRQPYNFQNLKLNQGKNVVAIAAWDSEGIAAMSGEFLMPDGTEFGTTDYEDWLVFPADKQPGPNNQANNPYSKDEVNPLDAYAEYLDVPDNWNAINFDTSAEFAGKSWVIPGYVDPSPGPDKSYPWGSDTTGDSRWIWIGENTNTPANANQETGAWYVNNFVLFRYEFICKVSYCEDATGWKALNVINTPDSEDPNPKLWNDIIGNYVGVSENPATYPVFEGGTLSFEGFTGTEYDENFYVNDFAGNTIDNAGKEPVFIGVLSGPGGMTFKGEGITTLAGSNTYTGATNIEKGTLKVTGKLSDSTAVTVTSGATYDVDSTDTIGSIAGGGSVELADGIRLTAGGLGTDTEFSGVMSGAGGFTKAGTGTTTFSGSNTYTGATNIEKGTLKVTGKLSDSTAVTVTSGATYDVDSTDTIGSIAGGGSVELADGIRLTAGGLGTDTEFSGVMSGAGGFTKAGTGTTTFSGSNTYTGATNIEKGTLKVTGKLSDSTAVTVTSGATYDVDSTDTIGSIAGGGSVELADGIRLTAGGLGTDTEFSGVMSGAGGFTKAGTETTTFSGSNTYTGATNIEKGTLKVTGKLSDSTAVTVTSGATYDVDSTDTIGSIAGGGSVELADGIRLTAGGLGTDTEFSGVMSGAGGFTKAGTGTTTFSGSNTYTGCNKYRERNVEGDRKAE
jgi:autotransporter-associated beta strand protein